MSTYQFNAKFIQDVQLLESRITGSFSYADDPDLLELVVTVTTDYAMEDIRWAMKQLDDGTSMAHTLRVIG